MKTAISVPDATYERVSRRAKVLGMSRSELFSRAAVRYLDELESDSVVQQIDQAVSALETLDDGTASAIAAGQRLLAGTADEW